MNLHTIQIGHSKEDWDKFIRFLWEEWDHEYKLELRGTNMYECERQWDPESDEYVFPEDDWWPWEDLQWEDYLNTYRIQTGIRLTRP